MTHCDQVVIVTHFLQVVPSHHPQQHDQVGGFLAQTSLERLQGLVFGPECVGEQDADTLDLHDCSWTVGPILAIVANELGESS